MTDNSLTCAGQTPEQDETRPSSKQSNTPPPSNDFVLTVSGKRIPLRERLTGDLVDINDIAHSLSMQNRFLGHTRHPYSIAQHSLNCVAAAASFHGVRDPNALLAILLHDAAEAYMGDIIRPVKYLFLAAVTAGETIGRYAKRPSANKVVENRQYSEACDAVTHAKHLEENFERAIYRRYRIPSLDAAVRILLREVDTRMCATESSVLCACSMPAGVLLYPMEPEAFDEIPWHEAKEAFLRAFFDLIQERSSYKEVL